MAALAGGSLIFIVVVIAILFAVVSASTRIGEARSTQTSEEWTARPLGRPSEASGKGRTSEDNPDEFSAGGGFSTHGTK